MTVLTQAGYSFEIENGKILSAMFGSCKVSLGDEVKIGDRYSGRLGFDESKIGKVVEISQLHTNGRTSDIIGVDFCECGVPTSQLKIYEVVSTMALRA